MLGSLANGFVKVEKTAGESPFYAYGVVNDGPSPGERSGDGAFLAARESLLLICRNPGPLLN